MTHVEEAMAFLALRYESGDKVFIFGFSRGAFTTRIIAGILHKCGLREAGWSNLQPYFSENYLYGKDSEVNAAFKATFGRPCPVHFLGVWDTVSTVGWVYNPSHFQYTQNNPEVSHVRHAVSIDERRCFFRTNLWGSASDKNEVWFAGSHCDVGGGYPEVGPAPWKVPFQWMVGEAEVAGLKFDDSRVRSVLAAESETQDSWHLAPIHQSLVGKWLLCEWAPKRYWNNRLSPPRYEWAFPKTQPRFIPDGSVIHQSVVKRIKCDPAYRPQNMSPEFLQWILRPETSTETNAIYHAKV